MGEILIKADNVSKKFAKDLKKSLYYGFLDVFSGVFGKTQDKALRKDEFWAVKDISFEVRRGECLGLIGHNGAGKSTLLKILNGLISPDEGTISMYGKVGALIELGAGFNGILTGRENIYNNAAVIGFSKKEIDDKLEEIIAFSELEEFIDMPVQNYSSGMKVRLGFAIAAQMEPDILIIDEVLAVGDMGFVLKCFNHMDKLLKNSAVILVSHAMPHVVRMATDLLIMENGKQKFYGKDISSGVNLFYSMFKSQIVNFDLSDKAELLSVEIQNIGKENIRINQTPIILAYEPINIKIKIKSKISISKPFVYLVFYDKEQRGFAEVNNYIENDFNIGFEPNCEYELQVQFNELHFAQGVYSLTVAFGEDADGLREIIFRIQSALTFQVDNRHHGWVPIQYLPDWKVSSI